MARLIILKGLPASGKSTYCNEMLKDKTYARVNKDQIRLMVAGEGYYDRPDEKLIHDLYISNIKYCLEKGYNVLCDATQLAVKNETELRKIAKSFDAEVEVKFFDTPLQECIDRDKNRTGFAQVGEAVIRNFYNRYLRDGKFKVENPLVEEDVPEVQEYQHTPGLPWAIMCDLDGTLANMNGRSPFNWKACINDLPHEHIAEILSRYEPEHCLDLEPAHIIFMSGRDEVCREETTQWLKNQGFQPDHLYMRSEGDQRKDNIVKRELFDAHVRGKFNIMFVLDDRNQVVEMWRSMGLVCLQVAPGDF